MQNRTIAICVEAAEDSRREALALRLGALPGLRLIPREASRQAELVLLALGRDVNADMALAASLAGREDIPPVVLTGAAPTPELLLSAMRAGIGEFLPEPVDAPAILAALERLQARQAAPVRSAAPAVAAEQPQGRILLALGAKGGVGTTTVAVNLADALTRLCAGRTALLDLAQPQGETPIFLDLEYSYTWADVAQNIDRLDATYLESVMARHHSGLAVLPAPDFSPEAALSPQALRRILETMRQGYANVVVDAGTGSDEAALEALGMADEVLLVLDLSLPCLARAKRFIEAVRAAQPQLLSRLRLVANRKTSESDIGTSEAENILQQPVAWAVVNDYQGALSAINQGKTLAESDPRTAVCKGIAAMARDLCRAAPAKDIPAKVQGSLWSRLRNMPLGQALARAGA